MRMDDPHTSTDLPTVMPTANRPRNKGTSINDDTSRLDGVAKVTGKARYGRDQYLPNSLFVGFIRCPVGSAELKATDQDAAKAVPGVVEVVVNGKEGRYDGHTAGYIVAESKPALARALRALNADWKKRDVKVRIEDAMSDADGSTDETQALLKDAEGVLDEVYSTQVQTHSCLETHGACIDHRGDSATAYVSTQGTFAARDGLDDAIQLPRAKYEVVCEYVGGGFGSKLNGAGKEGVTAAQVAAKYKRPVYLFANRHEDHVDCGNRPSSRALVKLGYKKDGTILGGQIFTWGGVGVAGGGGGTRVPSGRYALGTVQRKHAEVSFNGGAPRAFRAPGCPQGAFVEELFLDEIAHRIGMDPLALRKKNDQSETRREMMDLGADLIGWKDRKANGSQKGVVRRGFGMGTSSWGRIPAAADCEVVINRDGSVEARTGTQDIGTGQRTAMGIMASDTLGIPLRAVEVQIGRSTLPPGPGSGGSVTLHNTAPAMKSAAEDAKKKLLELVANVHQASAAELTIHDGQVLRNNEVLVSWKDACQRIGADAIIGRGRWDQATLRADQSKGSSDGVQFLTLDVDTETGVIRVDRVVALQACGQVVMRKGAESQIIGGVIQGLSFALFENQILDRNIGAMVNPNLEMYKILGSADMPRIEPVLWTKGQDGVRSLGEPPTIPTAGAVACAVFNAIGAPIRSLPLTPDKVLAAVELAAKGGA